MAGDIKQRLTAFADAHARASQLAVEPGRNLDLGAITADKLPAADGRREIGDAFIRHGRPLPTVAQLLDYARLLARGAESLTSKVSATGGVAPSDLELQTSGVRPMSLSPHASAGERVAVAEQVLSLVTVALRIKPGDPADIFNGPGGTS